MTENPAGGPPDDNDQPTWSDWDSSMRFNVFSAVTHQGFYRWHGNHGTSIVDRKSEELMVFEGPSEGVNVFCWGIRCVYRIHSWGHNTGDSYNGFPQLDSTSTQQISIRVQLLARGQPDDEPEGSEK